MYSTNSTPGAGVRTLSVLHHSDYMGEIEVHITATVESERGLIQLGSQTRMNCGFKWTVDTLVGGEKSMTRGITILLPTFNEVDALPGVVEALPLKELKAAGWTPRIVVADGRSTDGTQELVTKMGLELIVQGPPAGKGFGMREAFARFLTHDDDVLVMLDADGTYAPKDMLRLIQHLERGEYDVVIGSRLRGNIQPGAMSRINWIGNHILTWCSRSVSCIHQRCLYRVLGVQTFCDSENVTQFHCV